MKKNIYLKIVQDYNDIIKLRISKLPLFCKKIIFYYKNILNKITIQQIGEFNICVLPIKQSQVDKKIEKIIIKICKSKLKNYKLVLSTDLMQKKVYGLLDKYDIDYYKGIEIKKYLLFNILEYINLLQKKKLHEREITILINENSNANKYIIEKLAKETKYLKIVSENIYKFKNIENELYEKYGIAVQFSNSYRKSLLKSGLIVNVDFYESEINEYRINNKAIIINLFKNIRIYTKLFNGIVINSAKIKLKKELKEKFKIYKEFNSLILYESLLSEIDIEKIQTKIKEDKINIVSLIGNNGVITKKEISSLRIDDRKYK